MPLQDSNETNAQVIYQETRHEKEAPPRQASRRRNRRNPRWQRTLGRRNNRARSRRRLLHRLRLRIDCGQLSRNDLCNLFFRMHTLELTHLLPIKENTGIGNRPNSQLLSELTSLIHIHFSINHAWGPFCCEFLQHGRKLFTRWSPISIEFHHRNAIGVSDELLETCVTDRTELCLYRQLRLRLNLRRLRSGLRRSFFDRRSMIITSGTARNRAYANTRSLETKIQ